MELSRKFIHFGGAGPLVLSPEAGKRLWHLFEGVAAWQPVQSLLRVNADGIFCQKCKISLLACAPASQLAADAGDVGDDDDLDDCDVYVGADDDDDDGDLFCLKPQYVFSWFGAHPFSFRNT